MKLVHIIESAFVKYLKTLSISDRAQHLFECARENGELFWELAEHFNEYDPNRLAVLVGDL